MSVRTINNSISADTGVGVKAYPSTPTAISRYVRNPTWPTISAAAGTERLVGLYAVFPNDPNPFAITVACLAGGNFTINFGDGTSTSYASTTAVTYSYSYSAAALANTDGPVTFTDAGDTVNRTAHGYSNGMTVQFFNIVSTTGITSGQTYYVINATADTFQISETPTGSAVALTTNGSGTLLPYKIATVTITPAAGDTLSTLNLNTYATGGYGGTYATGWLSLQIAYSGSNLTISSSAPLVRHNNLTEVYINQIGNVANFQYLFNNCAQLQFVSIGTTPATLVNTANMFSNCTALVEAPLFNTSSVTTMASMFSGCSALQYVPLYNTASVATFTSMFQTCTSLTEVPLLNTAAATTITSMFASCYALKTIPQFNFAAATTAGTVFNGCYGLLYVPPLNFSAATTLTSLFQSCYSLKAIGGLTTTSALTNTSTMFNGCYALKQTPFFNTIGVTTATSMFQNCYSLTYVPNYNLVAATGISSLFSGCYSLKTVPAINTAAATGFGTVFANCYSLESVSAMNVTAAVSFTSAFSGCGNLATMTMAPKVTFSIANCKFNAAALNALYTLLPTVVAQTITVTGNIGTATDNPAIATAKGWTVTG